MAADKHGAATLLGFDYGTRRIGVAVGQQVTGTASALETVPVRDGRPDWARIEALIHTWQPHALVVGIPYHMDGKAQPMTESARRFARQLHGRFGLPVHEADERLSSWSAEQLPAAAGRRDDIDALAAQLILQDWLHSEARDA